MEIKEFFEMKVGDKFLLPYQNFNVEYTVGDVRKTDDETIIIFYKSWFCNSDEFIKSSCASINEKQCISRMIKIPNKQESPIESINKKICELKKEIEKLEFEKKSLEIQSGKFYEILYAENLYKKSEVVFVLKIEGYLYYVLNRVGYNHINKDNIISYKKIEDISVLEKAWGNV